MPQISQQELGGDRERPNPIQQQGGEQVALGVNCGAGKLHEHLQMDKRESGSEGCLYMHHLHLHLVRRQRELYPNQMQIKMQ